MRTRRTFVNETEEERKERFRQYSRQSYRRNREKRLTYLRNYRANLSEEGKEALRENIREWNKAHPRTKEKKMMYTANVRAKYATNEAFREKMKAYSREYYRTHKKKHTNDEH